jgi:hypothetical protein
MSYTKLGESRTVTFERDTEHGFATATSKKTKKKLYLFLTACGFLLLLVGFSVGAYAGRHLHITPSGVGIPSLVTTSNCQNPIIGREWRSLSVDEKHKYLDAVRCLKEVPSRIGNSQSLYDDFPWIHYRIGDYCKFKATASKRKGDSTEKPQAHHSAAFLAWHRSFIHAYERALREDCGYAGHLA